MKKTRLAILLVAMIISLPINSEIANSRIIYSYVNCLNSRDDLISGKCSKIRDYISDKLSHADHVEIVDSLIRMSGVTPFYYDGVNGTVKYFEGIAKPQKLDTAKCKNNKSLHGYYDPTRRFIIVCSSNLEIGSSYLIDHVVQHEIVHAAQHCYGGTLSRSPVLKALYFSLSPEPDDFATVVEIYPKGQWINELEARSALINGLEIDYATLLYLSCNVLNINQ